MADIVKKQPQGVPETMKSRYRDMGDGTHALVVAAEMFAGDSGLLDAGNRVRVSNPVGRFDNVLEYDNSPLLWQSKITNASGSAAITHLPNESSVLLTVGPGDTIINQTKEYFRYQAFRSQQISMTFDGFTSASQYVTRRIGYFDGRNGIFLKENNGNVALCKRSYTSGAAIDTEINQNDWTLDKLNGTGNSGITFNEAASQLLEMDFAWQGVSRVRFGFVIDGILTYATQILTANRQTGVYMTTPNLPLRYEISAAAEATGTHTLKQICSQVTSEGGFEEERGIPQSASNGITTISVNARRPVLSIRPRQTFNSITNRSVIVPEDFNIFADDEDTFYEIVYGGTLTNASWANVDATYSGMEYDVSATAITGGTRIRSGTVAASGNPSARAGTGAASVLSKLPLALDIDGNHPTAPLTDILTVVCTTFPNAASDTSATINVRELR